MSSIRILHASDLHIAFDEQRRSIKDAAFDALAVAARRKPKDTWIALRKMALASSYDAQILEHLAEVIVNNAKHVKPGVLQIPEEFARQHHLIYLKEKLNAIVFTGDLATTGLNDDLKQVASFLRADYLSGSPHRPQDASLEIPTLAGIDIPVVCLPGNHDRYRIPLNLPTYLPGGKEFDTEVLDYQSEPVRRFDVPASGNLQVVIFAVDFTLKRLRDSRYGVGWIAQGRVYHGDGSALEKLEADTRTIKADIAQSKPKTHLCVFWALHFPPAFPNMPRLHKLIDENKLLEKADEIGVHGILAGHTHFQKKYRDTNPKKCPVFCCGTTTQHEPVINLDDPPAPPGNYFQVLTVSADSKGAIHIKRDQYRYGVTAGQASTTEKHWREI